MKTLTIFTPSYNRAHLLPRLYESLKNQSCQDFVWLIIDDGSKDHTAAIVEQFQNENLIEIQYIFQENQGMHGAHNAAYRNIKTELNTCVDSDDLMPENAVDLILKKWASVQNKNQFSGVVGLDADLKGNIIGTKFKDDFTTLEDFYLKGGKGDKKLVYRTNIITQYPEYPIFEGEKYVGLGYKYLLVDQDYPLVTLNEILVLVDYQIGGSSNNMFRQYYKNPKGFSFIRKQDMIHSKSNRKKITAAIHYVSSSIIAGNLNFISESPRPFLTIISIPFGVLLYLFVRFKNRNYKISSEL